MTWTIHPLHGVGSLAFGMERDAAASLFGEPQQALKTYTGSVRETRSDETPSLIFVAERLVEIELGPDVADVRFDELDVFTSDPFAVLKELYVANNGAKAGTGSVLFLNLGINTTGFIDLITLRFRDKPDERPLTVFQAGQFDYLLEDFSDWSISF